MEDIKLDTVEEIRAKEAANTLPPGVRAMILGDQVIFIKKSFGRYMPLPENEQQILREKHCVDDISGN